jgi:hypothetical protein
MSTIREDVSEDTTNSAMSVDDAADAFLKGWTDPEEVSKDTKGAKSEDVETDVEDDELENTEDQEAEETDEDPDADADEDESTTKAKAAKAADDDAEVTYSVDGVEHKVSVKELKRLAGQEAALTRKSQEVAAEKKSVTETRNMQLTALNTLVQRAEAEYAPYADIDYLVASKEMSTEDFAAVRSAAKAAWDNLNFLTQELGGVTQQAEHDAEQDFIARSQETIKVLSDPVTGIKGWGQQMYNDIREYAIKGGMNEGVVNRITDPVALKMIHKAMAYDNIKKVATKKVAQAPKTVLSSSGNSQTSATAKQSSSTKSAMAQLRAKGDRESAANAFLSRWATEADAD